MSDLISREQAIDALGERPIVWSNDDEYVLGARNQYDMDKLAIETVQSAQPTQLNTPNTLKALDCISRQDAVDIINGYAEQFNGYIGTPNDSEVYAYARGLLLSIERNISALLSAQPEKLTDKEQRIFLSAMGREEEVCKEVDDAWRDCREPYEDSLVHVCKEIRRKVKGALWT